MVFLFAVLVAVAAGVVAALVAARFAAVRVGASAAAERDLVVDAAVRAAVSEIGLRAASERHETVRAAVDTATRIASTTLGDSMAAGSRELDLRSASFERQVATISDELRSIGALVTDLQKERATQSGSLIEQLQQVSRTQQALAEHTQDLRQALANPKQRGQWGERMADDVLAAAGLVEGVNFHRQRSIAGGTVPDFRFLLPHDLELRMDVKFPVDNYLRAIEADADVDRSRHTKAFVADVRNRIRELAGRGYVDARDTVDCMLLFIPNEAVYTFLHHADPDVLDVALGQQVVLCSPSTLFAVLAVVRRSVEQFHLERTSDEILRCLGGLTSEWGKFADSLDKVSRHLDQLHRSFHDELNGTRRRVFQRTLDHVDDLRTHSAIADVLSRPAGPGDALAAQKAAGDVRALPLDDRAEDPDRPHPDAGVADAG